MKRVVIAHGWDGFPAEGWFPWLKRELEARGLTVIVPQLPDPGRPRIELWVPALAAAVGKPDRQTFFVGHSMGCQAIVRYLESQPAGTVVGGAVFVAGFFRRLKGLDDDPETKATEAHWLTTPIDLTRVAATLPTSVAIFSDDDPWVPLDNQNDFREKFGSRIMIEHAMGHFSGSQGVTEVPVVRDAVLSLV